MTTHYRVIGKPNDGGDKRPVPPGFVLENALSIIDLGGNPISGTTARNNVVRMPDTKILCLGVALWLTEISGSGAVPTIGVGIGSSLTDLRIASAMDGVNAVDEIDTIAALGAFKMIPASSIVNINVTVASTYTTYKIVPLFLCTKLTR
jgi:hypothetical protein